METLAIVVGLPLLTMLSAAFSNPGGVLALCVPRYRRAAYRRSRLNGGRWWGQTRAQQQSSKISRHLHRMVERADRLTCVGCGARWRATEPHFPVDHIVPWLLGGLTCLWNTALLCKSCNSVKSCYWVSPSGKVYYRGKRTPPARAAEILAAELRARRSPARWLRAFRLLPSWL